MCGIGSLILLVMWLMFISKTFVKNFHPFMPNVSKRSGEKDIDSFNKEFRRSRLTLTLMYLLVLAVVLFVSGGVTRSFFSQRLDDRFHRFNAYLDQRPKPISVVPPLADDVRADLLHVT